MAFTRPDTLDSFTTRVKTGYGNLYVTICEQDNKPVEVFAQIGKSGQGKLAVTEAVGRLVSVGLQHGMDVSVFINQLKGIGDESPQMKGKRKILSIPDAIGQVLEDRYGTTKKKEK